MTTLGTLFSGFGGYDIGAMAAGYAPLWGIEYDAAIADVARQNLGDHIITADILGVDPATLPYVDLLHASPPCPNFSNAKANAAETPHDISLALQVAYFILILKPRVFTLENVYKYRNSESWGIIENALHSSGYQFAYWHVCAADYGVPQTRRRMIAIARRDGVKPMLPKATHAENPTPGLFGTLQKWRGWYEVIKTIFHKKALHGVSESKKAKTGLVAHELSLIDSQNLSFDKKRLTVRLPSEPAFTCTADKSLTEYLIKNGRYYRSDKRFVANWQTFPIWYELPDSVTLACRGVGNAVPCLLAQRIAESVL